ncbi:hypothetical protein L596_015920 [Steinernema carpocapsae]|uniref:Uncharacterized protein n=1 Tax=Steinernema carpocapsae TaxID=34508 RepID=A0A4U5NHG0_STECR|nr:hypothetical protein L596_015920 [Steinernema carpocapsae]
MDDFNKAVALLNPLRITEWPEKTHDNTISALLKSLQARRELTGRKNVDYGSVLVFELREIGNNFYIELMFSKNAESELENVTSVIGGFPKADLCPIEVSSRGARNMRLRTLRR